MSQVKLKKILANIRESDVKMDQTEGEVNKNNTVDWIFSNLFERYEQVWNLFI